MTTFEFARTSQEMFGAIIDAADVGVRLSAVWTAIQDPPGDPGTLVAAAAIWFVLASKLTRVLEWPYRPGPQDRGYISPTRGHVLSALRLVLTNAATPDIGLTALASHLRLSKCYLSRVVADQTGFSLHTHIHGVRVVRSIERMRSRLEIKEIAALAGYATPREYTRQFTSWTMWTPNQFRHALLNAEQQFPQVVPLHTGRRG